MRVLLAHNNFATTGGAEVFVQETARILQDNGHEVAFLSCFDEAIESEWSEYFPSAVDYKNRPLHAVLNFGRIVYSRESKKYASNLIEDFKPDIVHCFAVYTKLTPSILDAFRIANVPVVCSFNDYKHICPSYKLFHHGRLCEACRGKHFHWALWKRCSHDSLVYSAANAAESYVHRWMNIYQKNIHTFLFASEFMARKTEEFWGQGAIRWRILRNPFDARKFSPSDVPGSFVLYFGRLIEEKGVRILVDAARIADDVPVMIVGDGPDRSNLENYCSKLRLSNVQFVGPKWGREMDELLRTCRCVVVPSLWHENYPYVILQSFAIGKPVIGSNRGGIPELILDGVRGIIYDATDAAALATHMQRLMYDPVEAQQLGANAKEFADTEFNDGRFYEELMHIYSAAIA